jgi:flagellar basal-body rod modification protein FlgD
VRLIELTGQSGGEHELPWDGLDDRGQALPPGQYRFQVIAQSENGNLIDSETRIQGVVDGIEYADEHPLLLVQGNKVAFDSVIAVASDL